MTTFTVFTGLRDAAVAEAARLARARAVLCGRHARTLDLADGDVWIARARRSRTRLVLRGRALLVWRVSSSDGYGRRADSLVVATLVPFSRDARSLRDTIERIDAAGRRAIDAAAAAWWTQVQFVNAPAAAARVDRERCLAEHLTKEPPSLYQPGLFDRRSDRLRRRQLLDAAESESAAAGRVRATGMWAARDTPRSELLLALLP